MRAHVHYPVIAFGVLAPNSFSVCVNEHVFAIITKCKSLYGQWLAFTFWCKLYGIDDNSSCKCGQLVTNNIISFCSVVALSVGGPFNTATASLRVQRYNAGNC